MGLRPQTEKLARQLAGSPLAGESPRRQSVDSRCQDLPGPQNLGSRVRVMDTPQRSAVGLYENRLNCICKTSVEQRAVTQPSHGRSAAVFSGLGPQLCPGLTAPALTGLPSNRERPPAGNRGFRGDQDPRAQERGLTGPCTSWRRGCGQPWDGFSSRLRCFIEGGWEATRGFEAGRDIIASYF